MLINKYTEDEFWQDMSPKAQDVHNKIYEFMIKRKEEVTHPKSLIENEEWRTLVYNVSLLAAWAVDDNIPGIILDSELYTPITPEN